MKKGIKPIENIRSSGFPLCTALLSLLLLAASCDTQNELPGNGDSGLRIPVKIRLAGITAGASEELRRSDARRIAPETVALPLGDGTLLEMSIEEEAAPLRAGEIKKLAAGSKFQVIAVKSADQEILSWATYTAHDATDLSDYESADLHVPENVACDFICISYNTTDVPGSYTVGSTLSTLNGVDNSKDLLYQKITATITGTNANDPLEMILQQQLTRVKLLLDCSYNGWEITAVSNTSPITLQKSSTSSAIPTGGNFNLQTQAWTNTTGTTTFNKWINPMTKATTQIDSLLVLPQANGIIAVIIPQNVATVENKPAFPSSTTTLTYTTALEKGRAYTFRVRYRTPKFADSNIYWNGSKLTFDDYTTTPNLDNQKKQGVFFKWGSLVGIAAAGTASTASQSWSKDSTIYVPTNSTTWAKMTAAQAVSAGKWTTSGWGGIPYATGDPGTVHGRGTEYLATLSIDRDVTNGYIGDICKYLNAAYRMPYSYEFGATDSYSSNSTKDQSDNNNYLATQIDGTTRIPDSGATLTVNTMYFPASGYRYDSSGTLFSVGTSGNYWSSSARINTTDGSYTDAYYLYFHYDNGLKPEYFGNRSRGMAVRCVLQ